jgi:hypothetical protein
VTADSSTPKPMNGVHCTNVRSGSWPDMQKLKACDAIPPLTSTRVDIKWKFKRADWPRYQNDVDRRCSASLFDCQDVDKIHDNIKTMITEAADVAIPRTSGKFKPTRLVYWNDDIKSAIAKRKAAFKKWKKHRTFILWYEYKRSKAIAQRVMRHQAAAAHWRGHCEGLDLSRPAAARKVWRAVGAIHGAGPPRCIPNLTVNGVNVVNSKQKADAFGAHFAAVGFDEGYEEPFLSVKRFMDYAMKPLFDKTERGGNSDALNCALTFSELNAALASVRTNTSPGIDCIPYILLKNLPPSALKLLLKFYNSIWLNGLYPKYWRVSLVIPMLKQGKDRPISLSNCMGKLLEKVVNTRLNWHLENKKILSKAQSGFRRRISTEDHMVYLLDLINKVLAVKQHLVAVFIDFTKAFDRVWRTGLFIRLRAIGIRGNMFKYLRNIFSHTFLRVKLEGVLSSLYQICNGILQGSVIPPTLFILLIDAINGLIRDITLLLFADDTTLVKSGANVNYIIEKLQEVPHALVSWCDAWGFKISTEKTTAVLFTNYHCTIKKYLINQRSADCRYRLQTISSF